MSELRVGLIGFGEMGRHHARVLGQLEGVRLVAVLDPARDGSVAGVPVVHDLAGLLRHDLDLCVVASPTSHHLEHGLALAEHRIHTLIEKPLAGDPADARRLADAFDDAGAIGCVGHIERYNPAMQALRARLQQGEVGEVYQIATRRQGPFPTRILDVGVILDLATHDVDSTAWVTGSPYRSVSAQVAHRSGREHEDLVAAVGSLHNGIVVNHLVNWLSPLKERVMVVSGEHGSFVADTVAADLTWYANGAAPVEWASMRSFRGVVQGDVVRFAIPKPEPLTLELAAFRDAVLGVSNDVVTMREAYKVVDVAAALRAAASSRELVLLDES